MLKVNVFTFSLYTYVIILYTFFIIVILDNIRSALNVGSIVRTCDAFGIKEIYFCGITPETDNPKVKKTALGAEVGIKAEYYKTTEEAVASAKKSGMKIIGLEIADEAVDIDSAKPEKNIALVVGNEVSGISEEIKKECDTIVKIPMQGVKESLNVAVAFGIAAHHFTKENIA